MKLYFITKTSLHGLDNPIADGTKEIDNLEKIVRKLNTFGLDPTSTKEVTLFLYSTSQHVKLDIKVQSSLQQKDIEQMSLDFPQDYLFASFKMGCDGANTLLENKRLTIALIFVQDFEVLIFTIDQLNSVRLQMNSAPRTAEFLIDNEEMLHIDDFDKALERRARSINTSNVDTNEEDGVEQPREVRPPLRLLNDHSDSVGKRFNARGFAIQINNLLVVTVPINIFIDDTSANKSRR
ncbi:unnamed protein product [Mytilus edulis]|uniref:Uncharacterized protein n=1 Tax=Mytilus edulis TaxID=6550 RepID=A0A8S3SXK4_MYTED|nr:unnamed protein product [Mytilus edulis]